MNYYVVDWKLQVIEIGCHDNFDAADEYAQKMRIDVLYLASQKSLANLKAQLNLIKI